jgi:hypothetical protein
MSSSVMSCSAPLSRPSRPNDLAGRVQPSAVRQFPVAERTQLVERALNLATQPTPVAQTPP